MGLAPPNELNGPLEMQPGHIRGYDAICSGLLLVAVRGFVRNGASSPSIPAQNGQPQPQESINTCGSYCTGEPLEWWGPAPPPPVGGAEADKSVWGQTKRDTSRPRHARPIECFRFDALVGNASLGGPRRTCVSGTDCIRQRGCEDADTQRIPQSCPTCGVSTWFLQRPQSRSCRVLVMSTSHA